ncbi:MAG: hypothetical protein HDR11_13370 [Lachnospiraceae bacterium]|nr:hypothetical protein [Lachnospiraceae bacterium]
MPAFLYGLHGHAAPLRAACREKCAYVLCGVEGSALTSYVVLRKVACELYVVLRKVYICPIVLDKSVVARGILWKAR